MTLKVTKDDTLFSGHVLIETNIPQVAAKHEYVYKNALIFAYYHLAGLHGIYLLFYAKWETIVFHYINFWITAIGITAGAHRLWSHKSYKAIRPLQIFLMLAQCVSSQNTVFQWVRDHRLHHKFSDTDADPHNATRGLFFSHIGWLMVRKHPEVKNKGKLIDISDIKCNSILMFQKRNAGWLIPLLAFLLPTALPVIIFNESISISWHINMLRFITNLNLTFLVNSAAHKFGYKPYDKSIAPSQNFLVSLVTLGEGVHNYHHVFPNDYRTSELGNSMMSSMTVFINICAWFGWAHDLKVPSEDVITAKALRCGDGSDS